MKASRHFYLFIISFITILMAMTTRESEAAPVLGEPMYPGGVVYSDFDYDGDGIKDEFRIDTSNTITLNDKSQVLISRGNIRKAYHYKYDSNNSFLILYIRTTSSEYVAYRYVNGKFILASEPIGAFSNTTDIKAAGKYLDFTTGPKTLSSTPSFLYFGTLLQFYERYFVNTKTHRIVRKSNYASLTNKNLNCYYAGKKTITLSSSGKSLNKKGPKLKYGQKVKLTRVFFQYSGDDASLGNKIFEISFSGKKGWFKDSKSIPFVAYNPKASLKKPFELISIGSMSKMGQDAFFYRVSAKRNGGRASEDVTYDLYKFDNVKFYIYHDPDRSVHLMPLFRIENSGNANYSCKGIAPGMTLSRAETILKAAKPYKIQKQSDHITCFFGKDPTDGTGELTCTFKNQKVSTVKYKKTIEYTGGVD